MKTKTTQNLQKSQLLGSFATPKIYLLIAKNSLLYYSEIALSALHLVESDTALK